MFSPIRLGDKVFCLGTCNDSDCSDGQVTEGNSRGVFIEGQLVATSNNNCNHCSDCEECFPSFTKIQGGSRSVKIGGNSVACKGLSSVMNGKLTSSTTRTFIGF